jgi:hypothetical protein
VRLLRPPAEVVLEDERTETAFRQPAPNDAWRNEELGEEFVAGETVSGGGSTASRRDDVQSSKCSGTRLNSSPVCKVSAGAWRLTEAVPFFWISGSFRAR